MKLKPFIFPIILFVLGALGAIIGTLFKIMHCPYAAHIMTIGAFVVLLAIFWIIIKLIIHTRRS